MKPLIGVELKRFLRNYKRSNAPKRRVAAVLHSVAYPYNVGGIFRLADAAKFEELVLAGITPIPPHPTINKVGRYKANNVNWRYESDAVVAVEQLKADGYQAVAVEITDTAKPYQRYAYPERTCLIVGNEDHGITKAVLNVCDDAVFVPMYGKGKSLNVHTALSVVVYHVLHAP